MKSSPFVHRILSLVQNTFEKHRIVCLLYFGSAAVLGRGNDHDLLLVMDEWDRKDLMRIKSITSRFKKIDFVFQYHNWLLDRGYRNYQVANHNQHFFHCLAEAQTLLGKNIFKENLDQLAKDSDTRSLLIKIEEYFGRLDRQFLVLSRRDFLRFAKKYIIRICLDMLLITKKISYKEASHIHTISIIQSKMERVSIFSDYTKSVILSLSRKSNGRLTIRDYLSLRKSLYRDYLGLFKKKMGQSRSVHLP